MIYVGNNVLVVTLYVGIFLISFRSTYQGQSLEPWVLFLACILVLVVLVILSSLGWNPLPVIISNFEVLKYIFFFP